MNNSARIEALLFVAGEDGLTLAELSSLTGLPVTACQEQITKLNQLYQSRQDSALCIIKTAEHFRLTTKEDFEDLLKTYAKSAVNQSLTKSAQDVLAIIAYKQPITRLEIDNYRGVSSSSGVLATLRAFGLISVAGQLEAPGRPSLYVTTAFFLDYLGINELSDLPPVSQEDLIKDEVAETALFGEKTENEN